MVGALDEYRKAVTQPREAISERVVQTKALPALIRATTELLRSDLDRQLNLFRRRNPTFFAAYRNSRIIVDNSMNTGPRATEPAKDEASAPKEGDAPAKDGEPPKDSEGKGKHG